MLLGDTAHTDPDEAPARRAIAAIDLGHWREALDLLRAAEHERALSDDEVELLAQAAYGAGEFEAAISAWELLHTRYTASGDVVAAANAATTVSLYLMMDTGLMAPVRGWATRAERLLEGHEESAVHAWLAVVHTYERFMSGDADAARTWAQRAIELGVRQGAAAPVAVARVAAARLVVLDGDVDGGLALLDEAAVATVSGELDPLTVGIVYCELICAMQGLAQYDRAQEWTDAMERWRQGTAFGGFNGRCRVHRAEMLRLRGSCAEAETEAVRACEELRPWMRREYGWPLTELGTIRLRKGDLAGAEAAFLAAHENGWDPQPGLALLRLAQGDTATAAKLIEHALEHPSNVPSKERPPFGALRRAPLLEAQVEIALAAGAPETAGRAAGELTEISGAFHSAALIAAAALARARVALSAGDPSSAVVECEATVAAWSEIGAPYEAAVARMVLAQAHEALGNAESARLEVQSAGSAFERVGAAGWADRARALLEGGAAASPVGPPPVSADVNVFALDGDTRTVTFGGETVRLRDLKGMRYVARLLAEPGREFHALDLLALDAGGVPGVARASGEVDGSLDGDAGALVDAEAREAYRRRLADIEEDIDEATRMNDLERAALAAADRDYLVAELSRAFGLGGAERRVAGDGERARASVTRAVRYATDRVAEHHPRLAEHLRSTLRTGIYCSYAPDPRAPISWKV